MSAHEDGFPQGVAGSREAVDALFARLARKPAAFDLFQAMRRIEGAHPDKPGSATACVPATSRSASPRSRR